MVLLTRLSQRRTPAVVALWAIVMLFVAPAISTLLAHQAGLGMAVSENEHRGSMAATMPADCDMSAMGMQHTADTSTDVSASNASHNSFPDQAMPLKHTPPVERFACGYCELLAHFALTLLIYLALIWLLFTASRAPAVPLIVVFAKTFFTGSAQPRAPPATHLLH